MRMLPQLQVQRPNCHVVIVGADGVSYGAEPTNGRSWRKVLQKEVGGQLDLSRINCVDRVTHSVLLKLFQVSACHIYPTYPFVLSWSLLEAMSCGAVIIGSATPPAQEVIRNKEDGLMVNFIDGNELAGQITEALESPETYARFAIVARNTIKQNYELNDICLPSQKELIEQLTSQNP